MPFAVLLCLVSAGSIAAADPQQIAYVSSEGSGVIAKVDVDSLRIVGRIEVGDRPHNLKVTGGGLLVVATQGADTVSVIDPTKDPVVIRRIRIGAPPHDVAVGADGRTVFAVSGRGIVAILDSESGRILRSIKLKGRPHNIVIWGDIAWISDILARAMFIVDGDKAQEVPISTMGHDLAVRPASEELWITPWSSNRVVIFDLKALKEIASFRVGRTPSHQHLAFTEDGTEAWITEPRSRSLFVVNAHTRSVVDRVDLGGHPHHVRIRAGRVYVAVGQDLVVLDLGTRKVIGRLAVGPDVHDVAFRPPK